MSIDRNWIVNLIDSRWFALFAFACACLSTAIYYINPQVGWRPLLIGLVPWGIRLVDKRFPFQRTRLDFPIAIFLLTAVMGVWAAYDRNVALDKLWLILSGILIYYALAGQPRVNHWLLAAVFCLLGTVFLINFFLTNDWQLEPAKFEFVNQLGLWWMSVRPTLQAPNIKANSAGGVLAIMIPFLVAFALRFWREKRYAIFLAAASAITLALIAILLTTSRGAWVALASALGIWLLWGLSGLLARVFRWPRSGVFTLALLTLSSLLLAIIIQYPGGVSGVVNSLPGPPNAEDRLTFAGETIDLITDFPFTGGGLGSFPGLYSHYILLLPIFALVHGHNLYLNVALELGLIGLLAMLALLIGSGRLLISWIRRPDLSHDHFYNLRCATLTSLLAICIHGLVDYDMDAAPLLFLLAGMAVTLAQPDSFRDVRRSQTLPQILNVPRISSKRGWQILGVVLIFAALVTPLLILRGSFFARWYANLGALQMARVELQGWPLEEGSNEPVLSSLAAAEASFNKALQWDPEGRTAHHRLGLIAFRRGDFTSAVHHLEQAYQLDENHRGIWRSLGSSYVWSGKSNQNRNIEVDVLTHEIEDQDKIFVAWLAAEREPGDWLWLAYEALKAGDEDTALVLLGKLSFGEKNLSWQVVNAAKDVPRDFLENIQTFSGVEDSLSLWFAVVQAINKNRFGEALLAYHALQFISMDDGDLDIALFLWDEEDELGSTEVVIQQAILLYPDISAGYFAMGTVLERQNRYSEAMPWFIKALEINPDCRWCYMHLADHALQLGDLPLALEIYVETLSRFPNFAHAYSQISWAYHLNSQPQEAMTAIEQAMALVNPLDPWMLLRAAEIYEGAGEFEQALSIYISILEINPDIEKAIDGIIRLGGTN